MALTKKDREEIKSMIESVSKGPTNGEDGEFEDQMKMWEENAIRLACGITLAPEDYHEGERNFFTWDEAMEIEKQTGGKWRLPTPEEWMLICAERGTDENGVFFADILEENVDIALNGWVYDSDMDDYREGPTGGGSLYGQGTNGRFWSAAAKDGTFAYNLAFNGSSLNPQYTSSKGSGFTVRCVAR